MTGIHLPAPAFCLPDLDGRQHCLGSYRGRLVVINFWSAECPHSARVDAGLLAVCREWGDAIALLSIAANADETPAQVREAAARRGLEVVLLDSQRKVADLYEAQTTPHLFLIDGQGILRYQGAFDDITFRQRTPTRGYLRDAVQAILDGGQPETTTTSPYGCSLVRYSGD